MKISAYLPLCAAVAILPGCKDKAATTSAAPSKVETYVLANPDRMPAPGTKVTHVQKTELTGGTVKGEIQGQKMDGVWGLSASETDELTYLSGDKVTLKVTASGKSQTMKINDQTQNSPDSPSSLLDVSVTLTRSAGKWTAALEGGGVPTDEQKSELEKKERNFNKNQDVDLYGTEARKVGDTWSVDASKLPFAEEEKDAKGQVKFTFKSIEDFEGRKCARLEGPMEMTAASGQGGSGDMSLKGTMSVLRSLDDMIDLEMDFTGKMEMKRALPGNGSLLMGGDMNVHATAKASH